MTKRRSTRRTREERRLARWLAAVRVMIVAAGLILVLLLLRWAETPAGEPSVGEVAATQAAGETYGRVLEESGSPGLAEWQAKRTYEEVLARWQTR